MPSKPKKKGFSIQGFDAEHFRQTEAYAKAIDDIYSKAISDFTRVALNLNYNPDKLFSFNDYPSARNAAQSIIGNLSGSVKSVIYKGSREQWLYACRKSDEFIKSIMNTSRVGKKELSRMQDRNLDALDAFQKRKVDGMDLSKRVWNYTDQLKTQMELGIDIGLGDGLSAQKLSQDLRQYLVDSDKLFRRVRDKHGQLVLSKNAAVFNPGQGKYRSSYKNAMRLTRSEINMAYRTSDNLMWNQLDFVVGFEVKTSNKHNAFLKEWAKGNHGKQEICDQLNGRYPKSFVFKGWHPQCMCFAVPILMDRDEFNTDELNELKAALNGEEYQKYQSRNEISDLPDSFKEWVCDNAERIDEWKSKPYFLKDNFVNGKLEGGLKIAKFTKPNSLIEQEMKFDFEKGIDVEKQFKIEIEKAQDKIVDYERQINSYRKEMQTASSNLTYDKYIKNYREGEEIPKYVERDKGTFEFYKSEKVPFSNKIEVEYRKYKSEGATVEEIQKKIAKYDGMLNDENIRLYKLKSGELFGEVKKDLIRKKMNERADDLYYKFVADDKLVPDIAKEIEKEFGAVNKFKAKSTNTNYVETKEFGKIRISDHDSRFEQDQSIGGQKASENRPVEFDTEDHNIVFGKDKNGISVRIDDKEYYIHEYKIETRDDLIKFILSKLKKAVNS